MTLDYRIRNFATHAMLGPVSFLNGIPERGPRNPDTVALAGGLVGTMVYFTLAKMVFGL